MGMTNLQTTVGVIQQDKSKFSAQSQPNPKGMHYTEDFPILPPEYEEAKAVTVLRSGKVIEKAVHPKDPTPIPIPTPIPKPNIHSEKLNDVEPPPSGECSTPKTSDEPTGPIIQIPAPYPQRLRGPTKPATNTEVYEVFKQVKINIPLDRKSVV